MGTFTVVTSVSRRYYDKRNRSTAEFNIRQMQRQLGKEVSTNADLAKMPKQDLITLALSLHNEFPE
jgi:hypothetical protein